MVNELWSGNNVTMLNDMLNMTGFIVLSVQTLELQYSMKQLLKDRIYPAQKKTITLKLLKYSRKKVFNINKPYY